MKLLLSCLLFIALTGSLFGQIYKIPEVPQIPINPIPPNLPPPIPLPIKQPIPPILPPPSQIQPGPDSSSVNGTHQVSDVSRNFMNMRLFTVARQTGGYLMTVHACQNPEVQHFITDEEFEMMKMGKYQNSSHNLETFSCGDLLSKPIDRQALVLHLDNNANEDSSQANAADEFAFALQSNFPSARIYRDPLSDETDKRVGKLNHFVVKTPQDLIAVIAPETFGVNQTAIHNIEEVLREQGVQVSEFQNGSISSWDGGEGKGVIVITGHSNEEMANFIRAVGKAGYFRNNYVLFNSCETELTRKMITQINSEYGAVATFAHQGTIEASKVNLFINDLISRVLANESQQHIRSFGDFLIGSLRKYGLNGLWTLCFNDSASNDENILQRFKYV